MPWSFAGLMVSRLGVASLLTTPKTPQRSRDGRPELFHRFCVSLAGARWSTAITWWLRAPDEQAPGFVPRERSANPAPTPAQNADNARSVQDPTPHKVPGPVPSFRNLADTGRKTNAKKKTPAPEGPGSIRRMGEGLGAGGHSIRRRLSNAVGGERFRPHQIIFLGVPFLLWRPWRDRLRSFRAAAERSAARRETPDNANGYGDGHCCRQTLPPRTVCRPETVPEADVRADP